MLLKNVRPLNNTCRPMTDQSLTKDPAGSMRVLIAAGAGSRNNGTLFNHDFIKPNVFFFYRFLFSFLKQKRIRSVLLVLLWMKRKKVTSRILPLLLLSVAPTTSAKKTWMSRRISFPIASQYRCDILPPDVHRAIKPLFFSREFVVGSRKTLSFEVRLVNHGEPSYLTTIEIQLPIYTNLKRTPADLCQKPSIGFSDELIYSCQLRVNPLKRAKTVR